MQDFQQENQEEETVEIPINLPSEILEVLWELGSAEALLSEANLDTAGKDHMKWMREQLGLRVYLDGVCMAMASLATTTEQNLW